MAVRLALALLCALAGTASASADEASDGHDAAIALLNKMHTTENVTAMVPTIVSQVRANVTRGDPDLTKQFDTFAPKLLDEAQVEEPDLIETLAGVYAKTFTADEIRQMAAFYETPLGQKIVSTQGLVSGNIIRATRDWGVKVAQKLASEAAVNLQDAKP